MSKVIPITANRVQSEMLTSLWEPLLDILADKIVERLTASPLSNGVEQASEKETWLTPEQAAAIIGVDKKWLYRHSKELPFAKKLSRKAIRFNEAGLRRWLAARK
jgi:predicted DNA-binding transcriptional regulator AlpA